MNDDELGYYKAHLDEQARIDGMIWARVKREWEDQVRPWGIVRDVHDDGTVSVELNPEEWAAVTEAERIIREARR